MNGLTLRPRHRSVILKTIIEPGVVVLEEMRFIYPPEAKAQRVHDRRAL